MQDQNARHGGYVTATKEIAQDATVSANWDKEIGEIIGSSEGAARVNYFHGIRRLRELLQ